MWTDGNGHFAEGDCPPGWREATQNEVDQRAIALAWPPYQQSARQELDYSDRVAIACFKSTIGYPYEWLTRDIALIAVVSATSGNSTIPLPSRPILPTGIYIG